MKELRKLINQRPEVALGVAIFAGLALGAGWIPIPSLPSFSFAGATATPAPAGAPTRGSTAATPVATAPASSAAAPASSDWWG